MGGEILFGSTLLGPSTLKNRIVLPPIPNDLMAAPFRQRAGAGWGRSDRVRSSLHHQPGFA
ncbi:hypothetical protein NBRC106471_2724 [Acetobacter pasteurianus subsp. pasteurianus LMG 1262 = NBRC 106471]|jgi:N-ethylmaleimide reductase|nr:hypothetical protein NBRC106471_2724 [Acetobacter pasteurianus subsp. pasteurianus LMG 1262 = NBRC 106471]